MSLARSEHARQWIYRGFTPVSTALSQVPNSPMIIGTLSAMYAQSAGDHGCGAGVRRVGGATTSAAAATITGTGAVMASATV